MPKPPNPRAPNRNERKDKAWSEVDLARLRGLGPTRPLIVLCNLLRRPPSEVLAKAAKEGIAMKGQDIPATADPAAASEEAAGSDPAS